MDSSLILVVDDDADIRDVICEILREQGFRTAQAGNGAEALAVLGQQPAALILLDLMMPIMDGWQFRKRQQNDPALAAIPVVIITAGDDGEEHARALQAATFLRKPFDFQVLVDTVRGFSRPEA